MSEASGRISAPQADRSNDTSRRCNIEKLSKKRLSIGAGFSSQLLGVEYYISEYYIEIFVPKLTCFVDRHRHRHGTATERCCARCSGRQLLSFFISFSRLMGGFTGGFTAEDVRSHDNCARWPRYGTHSLLAPWFRGLFISC